MRILFASLLFILSAGLVGAAPAVAQTPKVGYINSQQILARAPGTSEAQQAFEADMTQYRSEIDRMGKELEQLQDAYEKQQATLSAPAKQEKQQELQTKFAAYQQRVGELERTAQRRQAELVEPIMKRVTEVIEEIRAEGGYALIFDAAAGSLITADPSLDLTDQVLARLQSPRSNPGR